MSGWFVTGTDTGIGKTLVSAALLLRLNAAGHRALGMKPVASGCARTPDGLRSDDAELLRSASAEQVAYEHVNPYAFEPAVAPHLAARSVGVSIDRDVILAAYTRLASRATHMVVEGVGGWRVPLADSFGVRELAAHLGLPVVLVVGVRLGCLNHALLTTESIERAGLRLAGWVANQVDPHMSLFAENVTSLRSEIGAPLLGTVPFLPAPTPAQFAKVLDLTALLHEREI